MDDSTTLKELRTLVARFVADRDWERYHTPKNLAVSIAIEAAELMEHFQWQNNLAEGEHYLADNAHKAAVADELADIVIYCLSFANSADIDVSEAICTKMTRNESRFPTAAVRSQLGNAPR